MKIGGSALDHISDSSAAPTLECGNSEEISVGHISGFPPGAERFFELKEGSLQIYSSARGLRAEAMRGGEKIPILLALNRAGEVVAKLNQRCPRNMVLSLMTGEMARDDE